MKYQGGRREREQKKGEYKKLKEAIKLKWDGKIRGKHLILVVLSTWYYSITHILQVVRQHRR